MKHVTVILTQEACAVLVAHFYPAAHDFVITEKVSSPSTRLSHGQQYDYYRDHAAKQGWDSITTFYPSRRIVDEARHQPVRLVG